MTKVNLKTLISTITIVMLIAINTIALAATNYTVSMSLTSNSKLKEGDTVTVNVNLTNINAGNGIDALTAQLDYDTNVFETVTTADIKSVTSWTPTFASQTNKMTALKNEKVTTAETVFSITLKVKSSISVDSTKVTLKNIVVSGGIVANGGTGDINVNDISVIISKEKAAESTTENTTKNDEITISKNNNTTTSSTTKNTVANDNTTAKKTLPKTGLQEYGVIAIVVVAIVGTFSYFVYKRIAKDVK